GESESKPLPEVPFAMHFRDIGWAVSNNNLFDADKQIILALHSGKFFGRRCNHSHADQNSFIITAGGDKLLWDAGYYDSYLSDHHRYYSRLTIAHNTILVNGVGQVPYRPNTDGIITRFEVNGKHVVMEGDAATNRLIYGGWLGTYLRTIEYKDEEEFIIQDDIFCSEYSHVTWLLHSCYPITYTPGDRKIVIRGEKYQLEGKFETDEPLEATLKTEFPVKPNKPADQIFNVASVYPEQYHLEITTVNRIESWNPWLSLKLSRIEE
ncbi:MAG: heparinase II/III-family protein, partial [Candidatus Marinimicrobia bacterium]|nr:heparinase II/III-family protein [Candidatus Neomarinimicrobiota bacterium]